MITCDYPKSIGPDCLHCPPFPPFVAHRPLWSQAWGRRGGQVSCLRLRSPVLTYSVWPYIWLAHYSTERTDTLTIVSCKWFLLSPFLVLSFFFFWKLRFWSLHSYFSLNSSKSMALQIGCAWSRLVAYWQVLWWNWVWGPTRAWGFWRAPVESNVHPGKWLTGNEYFLYLFLSCFWLFL